MSGMNEQKLERRIRSEFGCDPSTARVVAEKATALEEQVKSTPETWEGPEIDIEYIISRLEMAPDHLSVTGKWNWWAGSIDFFRDTSRDYRIN